MMDETGSVMKPRGKRWSLKNISIPFPYPFYCHLLAQTIVLSLSKINNSNTVSLSTLGEEVSQQHKLKKFIWRQNPSFKRRQELEATKHKKLCTYSAGNIAAIKNKWEQGAWPNSYFKIKSALRWYRFNILKGNQNCKENKCLNISG